uniref:Putative secreted protein n=1 Tax=Ixodes ricinus TaxID=34613 RepID=A0A6B0U9R3_IXORI
MNPCLYFLTLWTSLAWCSGVQLWWMIPMPPQRAIAIAISDSVTVSIGDETSGAWRVMFLVSFDVRSTSSALKSMNPGRIRKSL